MQKVFQNVYCLKCLRTNSLRISDQDKRPIQIPPHEKIYPTAGAEVAAVFQSLHVNVQIESLYHGLSDFGNKSQKGFQIALYHNGCRRKCFPHQQASYLTKDTFYLL